MFPRSTEVAYLDTAAEGLPPKEAGEALLEYYRDKAAGSTGRVRLFAEENRCREAAASLLGTAPENIAFVGSASDGLNALANSIEWRPGDEVVTTDMEFPSNVLAWLRLRRRGVTLRVLPSHDGVVTLEQFTAALSPRTRVVTTSQVSYKTGANLPYLPQLAEAAHGCGALLCVDATQAAGRVAVPLERVDFLVASAYKWLLGIHGAALAYMAPGLPERLDYPGILGWYSVVELFHPDRFEAFECRDGAGYLEAGMPNFASLYVLRRGLELLRETGVERIGRMLCPLMVALRARLEALGLNILSPAGGEYQSGIVSFQHARAERIGDELEKAGVVVWRGDGRVRASVHIYNDERDVETLAGALEAILADEGKS